MNAPVYGLVLAGGASRRMRTDKAALRYQDTPQLQRACELLQTCCEKVFVSTRIDQPHDSLRARWPLIVDRHPNLGPLAGIAAAQATHPEVAWLVIACDLPLLNFKALRFLLDQRDTTCPASAYRNPHDQQPEPLCAIWEPASVALVRTAIAKGEFSPRALLQSWSIKMIDTPEPEVLNNVNTPDEHQRAALALNASLQLNIQYFALFREQAGKRSESLATQAATPALLYTELQQRYGFKLMPAQLKVAVNNEFCDWQQPLKSGDHVAFIPPVAGG